jgi:hypothetical protein
MFDGPRNDAIGNSGEDARPEHLLSAEGHSAFTSLPFQKILVREVPLGVFESTELDGDA